MHTFAFRNPHNPPLPAPVVPAKWYIALALGVLTALVIGGAL